MNAYPTTPDLTIKAGDTVRSYDFVGWTNTYIEGRVTRVDRRTWTYEIAVTKRVIEGKVDYPAHYNVFPPMNGAQGMFGVTTGVVRI